MAEKNDISELLSRILSPKAISTTPDSKTTEEEADLEHQHKKTSILGLQQDIKERKTYAGRAFWLVVTWLFLIGIVIFLQGFKICGFDLSSGVLIALIGSTTSGVVGIFLIVTRYLFHYDDPPSK